MTTGTVLSASCLEGDAVERIHEASLQILEEAGVAVGHGPLRDVLADAGAEVTGDLVCLSRDRVESAVDAAPSAFTLHARNPDKNVVVGGEEAVYAPAYGAPTIRTTDGVRRPSTIEDYGRLLKLVQCADAISCTGYLVCEATDVEPAARPREMVTRSLMLTDKPVMGDTVGYERATTALDLAAIGLRDEALSKPCVAGQITPVSPRRFPEDMAGGLLAYAERRQPIVFASAVMAGATGPATLAGAVALANAEVLFGVTAAQLVAEGTPVVYGTPVTNFDMRATSIATGSPEAMLGTVVTGQLADRYDLPSRAGGGFTDAKTIDDQAGSESAAQLAATMAAGTDFVLHAAGALEAGGAVSPAKFILDCERIEALRRLQAGFAVTDETLALDLIEDRDPGGDFLGERHTLESIREEHYEPAVADRAPHGSDDRDRPDAERRAADRVEELLEGYERPPVDGDVEAALERYVDRHE